MVFNIKGTTYYVVAFNKNDAVAVCLINKIGIVRDNLIEVDIQVDDEAMGKVFRSYEGLLKHEV